MQPHFNYCIMEGLTETKKEEDISMDTKTMGTDFLKSVYAGLAIAMGGVIFLSCENKVVGSFLFSLGLISVLVFGFNLYTGKVCNVDFLKKPLTLLLIWVGNLVGAMIPVILTYNKLSEVATASAANRLSKPLYQAFLDGIFCGFCIAVAVKGYAKAEGIGKFLIVVLGVMMFILAGAEHCVADMFYLVVGRGEVLSTIVFLLVVTAGNTVGGALLSKI